MRISWLVMPGNSARRRTYSSWGVRSCMVTTMVAASFSSEWSHTFFGGKAALGGTQSEYP